MAGNFTFTMIKPGAVNNEYIGPILHEINKAHFHISAMKMIQLRIPQAKVFYSHHKNRDFFNDLITFMTSGPVVVAILEKENAVSEYRKLIGNTDPQKAQEGTLRKMFATSVEKNAVHGSDSDENATREADFFFSKSERYTREGFSIF